MVKLVVGILAVVTSIILVVLMDVRVEVVIRIAAVNNSGRR